MSVTANNACGVSAAQTLTLTNQSTIVFNNFNIYTVANGGTQPNFTVGGATFISEIHNYHWNGGTGAAAGTITIQNTGVGPSFGPFAAVNASGCNPAQTNWTVYPQVTIPAETYRIIDSNPGTWSQNGTSGGIGFSRVYSCP